MRQRGRRPQCLEIRDIVEDLPPVVEEEQRRQDIWPHLREQCMVEDRAEQCCAEHGEHNGGNDAAHTAQPEVCQADRAAVVVFLEKQAGDQIAGQHEEHRDAEKTARRPSEVHVICDYDKNGQRSQSIERRYVTTFRLSHRLPFFIQCKTCSSTSCHVSWRALLTDFIDVSLCGEKDDFTFAFSGNHLNRLRSRLRLLYD